METRSTTTRSSADTRFIVLVSFQILTLILVAVLFLFTGSRPSGSERAQLVRDTAAKLQAAGLNAEAINQYEEYLREPDINRTTRANIAYSVAQMYEAEGRPEKALVWYYQVGGSDPNSTERNEAAKRIVALLETLGRHQAAKAVLSDATSLEKDKGKNSGTIVAQVGDKKITLDEINASLDALPPAIKSNFEGAEGKKKYLKKYVADELLYEKAKRLQYDNDPQWLKQQEDIKRQVLVGRVLNEDVISKVNIDSKDLKNFFEANKSRYTQNKKTPSFDKVKTTVENDYRLEKSQAKYQELIESLLTGDNIKLFVENVK